MTLSVDTHPKIYLNKRVVQAKLFIDQHFADAIKLADISGEAHFSRFHFTRLFKKIYQKTPHQYLTHVRMEEARRLLAQNIPVSEVCVRVGFDSLSSFTGLFKRQSGISPSVYRNQQQQLRLDRARYPLKYVPNCFAQNFGWSERLQKSNFREA